MGQSIQLVYRHTRWGSAPFVLAAQAVLLFWRILDNLSLAAAMGKPYEIKGWSIALMVLLVTMILLYLAWHLTRHIRSIGIKGPRAEFRRSLGKAVSADLQDITLHTDFISVGRHFTVRLEEVDNKEKIKDFLAGHVKSSQGGKPGRRLAAPGLVFAIAALAILFMLLMPGIMEKNELAVLLAFSCLTAGFSLFFLVSIIRNMTVK